MSDKDTISRQAAIDALDALCDRECEYSKQQRSFMCGACRLGSAFDVIDELPSAQHEPHEGHWIPVHPIQSDDPGAYMCSKCKTGMWEIRPSAYHYCPNCGADMRGEQDGNQEEGS